MKTLKEIIITGIATFLISNCSLNIDFNRYRNWYVIEDSKIEESVDTPLEIKCWEGENITWVSDQEQFGRKDYAELPQDTLNSRKGDCEDKALLDLAIWYKRTGQKGSLSYGQITGHSTYHMEPKFNGEIFCPGFREIEEFPFDCIFYELYRVNETREGW